MKRSARVLPGVCLIGIAAAVACTAPRAELTVVFPADAGACDAQTSLACVNYLQFTVGVGTAFNTDCVPVDTPLHTLCDVAKLANGRALFNLPPETKLPIKLQGLRVFPATSCGSEQSCPPRTIFTGQTPDTGRIGDFGGRALELSVTMNEPCGTPEQFFPLPDGSTCDELCGPSSQVVCRGVQNGCLCLQP